MARVTLVIEDTFKDGKPSIEGRFTTDGIAPPPTPGAKVPFTPAQLFMETIRRLWDDGAVNTMVRRYVPDMLYQNNMLAQQAEAAKQALKPAANVEDAQVLPAPANVNNSDNAPVADAPAA